MKYLLVILPLLLVGCDTNEECTDMDKIGCICNNGNIYVPKQYNSKEEATQTCVDSCLNKNGVSRLFCN